jgi:hypothetical protein
MTSLVTVNALQEYDAVAEHYISALYRGLSGFISYKPGEKEEGTKEKIYLTYGEILYPSVNLLIDYIEDLSSEDVFYDLGSGIGKVPLHFFLKTPVKKACGVEASRARNMHAAKVYHQLKTEFPELLAGGRELSCVAKNFLEAGIEDATVIYTCSTCFSEELLTDIAALLDTCPKLRCVISLKELPLKNLVFDKVIEIECTWDKTKCYAYRALF